MGFNQRDGMGSDAAEGTRIERHEERARVYRIVAQNRRTRRLVRGAPKWLLRADFLAVATVEYPMLLESLKSDVMAVIEAEHPLPLQSLTSDAMSVIAVEPPLLPDFSTPDFKLAFDVVKGRAARTDLGPRAIPEAKIPVDPRSILEREPVRAALEAWWLKTRIRPPWLEQVVMDTLRAWVLGGMPGGETPGHEQWVIEPHVTEDPPGMGADLDELGSLRFDIGETKEEFLSRASRYYARGMRVLRMYPFLDPKRHSDHGVSRLDRLRMIAHARVGPLRPKDARKRAWELVCLHEPFSDDGEFGPRKHHGRYPEKRIDRLCREVECLLDLPPLKVRKSPISTS